MVNESSNEKKTCLYEFHRRRQARMELFAGYSMPIVYKDQTIKSEHMQTRNLASVFDVSHMMQTIVTGADRCKFIESLTTANVQDMAINKCTLSVLTNELGGIIDDCIIGKHDDHLHIVSNAGNADVVWSWFNRNKNSKLDVKLDRLDNHGLIALQGPKAAGVLQKMTKFDLFDLEFMNTIRTELSGFGECVVTRCGYTGEDGFEISIIARQAESLIEALCVNEIVLPAGLGARDTLRLEAGLCLHGHDITDKTTPVEAALSWVIHKKRRQDAGFPGAKTVLEQLKDGTKFKRVGLVAEQTGPPAREHSKVIDLDGCHIGRVTSGTFAPKLGKNIAMAYIPNSFAKDIGKIVVCEVRGKTFEYKLTKMPFVKSNYYFKQK